jgi:hypothetical protein
MSKESAYSICSGLVCGFTRTSLQDWDRNFRAGYSIYAGVWPLLKQYPGHDFQSGLFGTWMFGDVEDPKLDGVRFYSDIEGGLGWWRDTEFPTETPKFIMGAVARAFTEWANGPGAGKDRDWDNPKGLYGVAQLSNRLLWPPDGLNLRQGTCCELLGYGYLPLPLIPAKTITAGATVKTGDQCWTLFLNAGNFKGPAAFVLPYFFSKTTVDDPRLEGMFLDSVPSRPKRAFSMETQYIPWMQATGSNGKRYARMAPTLLPAGDGEDAISLHKPLSYNRAALWDRVKIWLDGGPVAATRIDSETGFAHSFDGNGGINWSAKEARQGREDYIPVACEKHVGLSISDGNTIRFSPKSALVKLPEGGDGSRMLLPEYYVLTEEGETGKKSWNAVSPEDVPAETGLQEVTFSRLEERPPLAYVTPEEPESCWKTPGPVTGPFTVRPGDGSEVTYCWYRFADQPALLNADLSETEREELQMKIEMIHRHWSKDDEYLPPPSAGTLAEIDPALIVTPPKGLEAGYVPIVTKQTSLGSTK